MFRVNQNKPPKNRKLDPATVQAIRDLNWKGATQDELGKRFGVSASTVGQIVRHEIYKDVS